MSASLVGSEMCIRDSHHPPKDESGVVRVSSEHHPRLPQARFPRSGSGDFRARLRPVSPLGRPLRAHN
eukprot:10058342-Alexandrium_andersonii.AAC.1